MKLTRTEDYAILIMAYLAERYGLRLVSLTELAQVYHISAFFLKNIALQLRHAGLIESKEGFHGGYQLAKPPQEISIGEIIRAVGGPLEVLLCTSEKREGACGIESHCRPKAILQKISSDLTRVLDSTNLGVVREYIH